MFAVLVVAGVAAGAWLLGRVTYLSAQPPVRPSPDAHVSVIVPSRDEAETIPALLASLARLEVQPCEVLVVNDGSRDRTADVAAACGARVISVTEPPPGWLGKPWACQIGRTRATGTHLLFLDADTRLAADALGALLATHAEEGGLVSVQPYHETQRPYENLSAYCNLVAMMGTGAFTPRAREPHGAFGPCLLTSASEYDAVGGHAAVRSEVAEDVHLARKYRRSGFPVSCFAGGDLVRFRMYPAGARQLVDGWSKNLAAGAVGADRLAVALTVLWVSSHAAIAVRMPADLASWTSGSAGFPFLSIIGWFVIAAQLRGMLRRVGSFAPLTAILFPIPLAAFITIFGRSLFWTFVRRRVVWRGRQIELRSSRP